MTSSSRGLPHTWRSKLEYRLAGASDSPPAIVMLHEGLGSAALWGDFPDKLAAATGRHGLAYSRAGYGRRARSPCRVPSPTCRTRRQRCCPRCSYDRVSPRAAARPSDGASIAAIYVGSTQDHRVRGLVLIAPHFIVEDVSIDSIAQAKTAYEQGDLKTRLARWHKHVDVAFRGWNDAWLDPAFRSWDISDVLAYIRVPVQVVQGESDQYATVRRSRSPKPNATARSRVAMIAGRRARTPARAGGRHARRHRGFRQPDPQAPPRGRGRVSGQTDIAHDVENARSPSAWTAPKDEL